MTFAAVATMLLPALPMRAAPAGAVILALLSGCAHLLPETRSEEPSPFAIFEDARAAIERIEPHRTSVQEMKALGLDSQASSNVREVPYPQLVGQLVESPSLALSDLDPGIRECIAARQRCRAYRFRFSRVMRERGAISSSTSSVWIARRGPRVGVSRASS